MPQGTLRQVMVVHPHVLAQQGLKARTALEVMRAQHLADAPVETLG